MKPGCPATVLLPLPSGYIINAFVLQPQGQHKDLPLLPHGSDQFSSVQSLSRVRLFGTLWTAACHASLFITNSRSLLKLMFIELVMPSNHFILCRPLLLSPSIFPSIRVFSNESALRIRWPNYDQTKQHIKKQRHYFADKGPSSQGYGFSSSHVWT